MDRLNNIKVLVNDPDLMEEFQTALFNKGYTWPDGTNNLDFLDVLALYLNDGILRVGIESLHFYEDANTQITVEELRRYLNPTLKNLLEELE